MLKRLSSWLYRISKSWVVLLTLAIFTVFLVVVLPQQAELARQTSNGAGSPDSSLFYTPNDLYRFAETYGETGRAAYIRARFSFDVVWPIAYMAFLASAISWFFARGFDSNSRWRWANLAPVLGLIFDYAENSGAALVMARYPAKTPIIDWLTPVFSLIKWFFVNGSFVLVLIGLIAWLWQTWRQRGKPARV